MGQGDDLEAAAAPYHAVQGDPRGYEAPGHRCSRACLQWTVLGLLGLTMLLSLFAFSTATQPAPMLAKYHHDVRDSFSVRLDGHEGIDPGRPGSTVSPAFRVTLKMHSACVDLAVVTVLYSGVALGWARVEPRDCVSWRLGRDVDVVARGDGVGLSERLRGRMASEYWRSGAVELDVDVKIFDEPGHVDDVASNIPSMMMLCKVRMDGRGSESSPCLWFAFRFY